MRRFVVWVAVVGLVSVLLTPVGSAQEPDDPGGDREELPVPDREEAREPAAEGRGVRRVVTRGEPGHEEPGEQDPVAVAGRSDLDVGAGGKVGVPGSGLSVELAGEGPGEGGADVVRAEVLDPAIAVRVASTGLAVLLEPGRGDERVDGGPLTVEFDTSSVVGGASLHERLSFEVGLDCRLIDAPEADPGGLASAVGGEAADAAETDGEGGEEPAGPVVEPVGGGDVVCADRVPVESSVDGASGVMSGVFDPVAARSIAAEQDRALIESGIDPDVVAGVTPPEVGPPARQDLSAAEWAAAERAGVPVEHFRGEERFAPSDETVSVGPLARVGADPSVEDDGRPAAGEARELTVAPEVLAPGAIDWDGAQPEVPKDLPGVELEEIVTERALTEEPGGAPGSSSTTTMAPEGPGGSGSPSSLPPVTSSTSVPGSTAPATTTPSGVASAEWSCVTDGESGRRVQLVFARPTGSSTDLADVVDDLVVVAAGVDARVGESAARTGGIRGVRWAHGSDCVPTVVDVEISPSAAGSFSVMVDELRAAGLDDPARKYVVFAEATTYCGVGHIAADDSPGLGNANNGGVAMFARLDSGCWQVSTVMHELGHVLGAVQTSAPHATTGFHCTDEWDVLCEADTSGGTPQTFDCPVEEGEWWDCGNDDYFHTDPDADSYLAEHWNIADSGFLTGSGDDGGFSDPGAGDVFDLLIVQSSGSGASGDFGATPASSLGSHDVGVFAGSADLTYDVPSPAPEAGPAPSVSLSYSSAAVNGMNTSRNNQPGPIGAGWSLNTASITRHLKTCGVPQALKDKCLDGDEYSITLNGVSSRLVKVSGNTYRLASDPAWRVTKYTGGLNYDTDGDFWVVTDTTGVDYTFGFSGAGMSWVPVYDATVCAA